MLSEGGEERDTLLLILRSEVELVDYYVHIIPNSVYLSGNTLLWKGKLRYRNERLKTFGLRMFCFMATEPENTNN